MIDSQQLVLSAFSLCHRSNRCGYASCFNSSPDLRSGSLLHGESKSHAVTVLHQRFGLMDAHHEHVFIFSSAWSAGQILGCCNKDHWCRRSDSCSLHRLSDTASKDASMVQVAYLDQSGSVRV